MMSFASESTSQSDSWRIILYRETISFFITIVVSSLFGFSSPFFFFLSLCFLAPYTASHSDIFFLQLKHPSFLDRDWALDLSLIFLLVLRSLVVSVIKAFVCDVLELCRQTSSLRRLLVTILIMTFSSGAELVNDNTSVFQLWGREINNSNAYNSSSKETFIVCELIGNILHLVKMLCDRTTLLILQMH